MERVISVDGKEVRFRASAAIPRMYRLRFRRDIIHDMQAISAAVEKAQRGRETGEDAPIPMEMLTMFENVAYLMAKHADPALPPSVDEWLENFDTFSIYLVFPVILELWEDNLRTLAKPAKK